jgi:hypothetical protein
VTIAIVVPGRKAIAQGELNLATDWTWKGGREGDKLAGPSEAPEFSKVVDCAALGELELADVPQAARTKSEVNVRY